MPKLEFQEPLPKKKVKTETGSVEKVFAGTMEEDEYLEKLGKIIRRDFFPDLESLEPLKNDLKSDLPLNEFLARYNSEDNESFAKLIAKEKQLWIDKFWWLGYSAETEKSRLKPLEDAKRTGEILNYRDMPLAVNDYEERSNLMFLPNVELRGFGEVDLEKKVCAENTRITINTDPIIRTQANSQREYGEYGGLTTPNLLGFKRGADGGKPQIRGYSMLSMPSPTPSMLSTPLMTWGEMEGEAQKITDRVTYKIPLKTERETLQEEMLASANRKKKEKQRQSEDQIKSLLSCTPGRISSGLSSSRISLGGSSVLRKILDDKSLTFTPGGSSERKSSTLLTPNGSRVKAERLKGIKISNLPKGRTERLTDGLLDFN